MEKDKLEKAAESAMEGLGDFTQVNAASIKTAFKQGAEWLMCQPIAERLSEDERENYRCIYSTAQRMIDEVKFVNPQLFDVFNGQLMMLKSIFGKEMFENLK